MSKRPGSGWRRLKQRLSSLLFGTRILCDTCRYDYGDVCRRPERPNATECDDYEHK